MPCPGSLHGIHDFCPQPLRGTDEKRATSGSTLSQSDQENAHLIVSSRLILHGLNCHYAYCQSSPSFDCEFKTSDGVVMAKASDEMCKFILPDQGRLAANEAVSYNCTLTRRKRNEEKQITIDRSVRKGKR
ncbi:hypothetical protein F2P81_017010 [Scophthalmus maximus]|uniref:Uncharacterized protein n=1 Tax=Scophthalmus maximus TaxID=52904 RepID=A0A6A4SCF9_SCOMX|nr:hypothetical protein F2P81_017010 [Scophthalmus maximus]